MSYQLSAISPPRRVCDCQPEQNHAEKSARAGLPLSAGPARSALHVGFTLIEMVVVVAIIGLLLAIAVPVSTGVLNSQKASSTKMTMQTLEVAIGTFATDKPMTDAKFGSFPPSPVSAVVLDSTVPDYSKYGPSEFEKGSDSTLVSFTADDGGTKERFEGLVRTHLVPPPAPSPNGVPTWYYNHDISWHKTDHPDTDKYLSIETLMLFLRQLSPQARHSVDRMQKHVTNNDKDVIAWDVDGAKPAIDVPIDLFEINDSWGNPLRYSVQSPVKNSLGMALKIRWELRSAGPDGKFNRTFNWPNGSFLPEDQVGDDVILRGP